IVIRKVVFDPRGLSDYTIHAGIRQCADMGCAVANLSWSSPTPSDELSNAVAYAQSKGMVLVIAPPNADMNLDTEDDYPT
ncbi:S8 family serine peptidase, partial [Streptococcus pseudopneumoniae]|uniref:S8 family serine peptidase n=1 Tax=Streptococcus pseudopneumoniae TaxID=257758 RepID=UPI0019D5FF54